MTEYLLLRKCMCYAQTKILSTITLEYSPPQNCLLLRPKCLKTHSNFCVVVKGALSHWTVWSNYEPDMITLYSQFLCHNPFSRVALGPGTYGMIAT